MKATFLPIESLTWQGPDMRVESVKPDHPAGGAYVPHCGCTSTLQTAEAFAAWQALVVSMGEGSTVKQNNLGIWVPEGGPFMDEFQATLHDMANHFARWGTA